MDLPNTTVHIRQASPEDSQSITAVTRAAVKELPGKYYSRKEKKAWLRVLSKENMQEGLEDPNTATYIAETTSEVVGFATLDGADVRANYVHPDFQNQGVGSVLLRVVEKEAKAAGIEKLTVSASLNAVAFYEKQGYRKNQESTVELGHNAEISCIDMEKGLK